MEALELRKEDLDKLKFLSKGNEGSVYYYKDYLIKIFKNTYVNDYVYHDTIIDEDGVKVFNKKNKFTIKKYNAVLKYYDKDGVRMLPEESIKRIIMRQKEIKGTKLPFNYVKINDKVKGTCIHNYKYTTSIYSSSLLSFRLRLKIMQRLLYKLKELNDNYIYPADLSSDIDNIRNKGNVLLSLKLEPYIIDMDGCNVTYLEKEDKEETKKSINSYSILLMEILSKENLNELFNECDYEYLKAYTHGIFDDEFIELFFKEELTYKYIDKFIKKKLVKE